MKKNVPGLGIAGTKTLKTMNFCTFSSTKRRLARLISSRDDKRRNSGAQVIFQGITNLKIKSFGDHYFILLFCPKLNYYSKKQEGVGRFKAGG